MLAAMGAVIESTGLSVTLSRSATLTPLSLDVPGDVSSASFLIVAAAVVPGSNITVSNVGVNPTRIGLLDVLREMQAGITVNAERKSGYEPVADISMRATQLAGVRIGGSTVVRMIDEFPALAVAATQARGTTIVRDAAELRVKETDRIDAVVTELRAMGAVIEALPDGFAIEGPTPLRGTTVDSRGDHRLAMALAVASLVAKGETTIRNAECIADSFPGFEHTLSQLRN
jgi:3-phosphoshikimate 1-carboxyvinyltransferase